ncbi:MAG: DUF2797 domain-containing protein [Candidatus Nanohaloarchaea archaeon]
MKSIVKVRWQKNEKGKWLANLFTATENGFESIELETGREISFEVGEERRCTGYAPEKGEREPCPEFRKIDSGSQCSECRSRDIYTGYVRGDRSTSLDGEFSVYMAQIGEKVKVGVTRSEKVERRWVEQGADYAAELESGLEAPEALQREEELTYGDISQRVSKSLKVPGAEDATRLERILAERSMANEVIDVQSKTVYPRLRGLEFRRSGRIEGEIRSVKGQIVSNGRMWLAMGSGRILRKPRQRGLSDF